MNQRIEVASVLARTNCTNLWMRIVELQRLHPDSRISQWLTARAEFWKIMSMSPFYQYLDCIPVEETKFNHKFLIEDSCIECLTFGMLNFIDHFALYSYLLVDSSD